MSEGLIIVESPAKARTLKRFLGNRFDVRASMGHVRDLPNKELAVDVEHNFQPRYEIVESRRQTIDDLKKSLSKDTEVILASDPDREGEAIAWHLSEVLRPPKVKRIAFHEITDAAVKRALEHPREIDMRLVNAQQARRIVDRLVGYRLSPFLWSKVQKGIGVGRVQSVALRLVCDREAEILSFKPEESWTIEALLSRQSKEERFKAKLLRRADADPKSKVELKTEAEAQAAQAELAKTTYRVLGVEKKERRKQAPPAYITSTLQQDASSRLHFAPRRTMRLAQDLYEGIELGADGSTGLITYMRTDSTRVSEEAETKVKEWIKEQMGQKYIGPVRKEKARPGAQEAHEAIRPTDPTRIPAQIKEYLDADQYRLYELIWRRFVASRMAAAIYAGTQVEISAQPFIFRASGSVLTFDGFYKVWEREEENDGRLPELTVNEELDFHGLELEQHFTQPPPRYNEATLIQELEKRGIGRPSTYASIVGTIQEHGYVEQQERRLHSTPTGEAVNMILVQHFHDIVDDAYTAEMEGRLDEVENGKVEWIPVVGDFYTPLTKMLSAAEEAMPSDTGEPCPECGEGTLLLRASRYGPFKGCSRYPECRYRVDSNTDGRKEPQLLEENCPQCGSPLQLRRGRYGEFIGCSGYPECKYIKKEERAAPTPTGEKCPECSEGEVVERQGRYGAFLACSRYPTCKYRGGRPGGSKDKEEAKPQLLDEKCPKCGQPMVERQGRYGPFKSCSDYPRCKGASKSKSHRKSSKVTV